MVSYFRAIGQLSAGRPTLAVAGTHGKSTTTAMAAHLVGLWVHSPNHNSNLRNSWTYTGIGIIEDRDGMVFATQMFSSYKAPMQRDMLNSLRVH